LKQELQQSKCHDLLCSNQELLKRAHPNECCIMKTKDGECHMKASFNAPDPHDYLDRICSNTDPLKRAHSPRAHSSQGTLSLIDPIGCCVMKRKDGECPDPEVKLYHRGAYRLYIEQPAGKMEYVWGDDESMINSPTVPEDKSHKKHNILSFHYVRSMLSQGYLNM